MNNLFKFVTKEAEIYSSFSACLGVLLASFEQLLFSVQGLFTKSFTRTDHKMIGFVRIADRGYANLPSQIKVGSYCKSMWFISLDDYYCSSTSVLKKLKTQIL